MSVKLGESLCPCHSALSYAQCCAPLHRCPRGASPGALMRSRYAAYASGNVDYILATTCPGSPAWQAETAVWKEEVRSFCESTQFADLHVAEEMEQGEQAYVTFAATLRQHGQATVMRERSEFRRHDGTWLYASGQSELSSHQTA